MEKLLTSTTAYRIFAGDVEKNQLSHAYMLYFNDARNLRAALKLFALRLFECTAAERDGASICNEDFSDCKIYPSADKKLSVADASDIVDDSALRPVERDKKLYIVCGFDRADARFQNKLLKILEEPPAGVYFLLGVTSLAPVLDTVKSRVKLLEIPPFSAQEILSALNRAGYDPQNGQAAESCGGVLGVAQDMLGGDWFRTVYDAAAEITCADTLEKAGTIALKYGDCKYKNELLAEMQRQYFEQLKCCLNGQYGGGKLQKQAILFALENVPDAVQDVKFNANFSALLYDFTVRVVRENDKWKRL